MGRRINAPDDNITSKTVTGVAVALIGAAIIGAWKIRHRIRRLAKGRDLAQADGDRFPILIADLQDDDAQQSQTRHIVDALGKQAGLSVRRYGRTLKEPDHGDLADGFAAVERDGREWLQQQNADVLIWGRVKKTDEVLHIRFLPRAGGSDAKGTSYRLTQELLELPTDFGADFAAALTTVALAGLLPETERH